MVNPYRAVAIAFLAMLVATGPAAPQKLGGVLRKLTDPAQQPNLQAGKTVDPVGAANGRFEPVRTWLGYSWQVQGMRPMLEAGDFAGALLAFNTGKDAAGRPIDLPARPSLPGSAGEAASGLGKQLGKLGAGLNPNAPNTSAADLATGKMDPLGKKSAEFLVGVERGVLLLDSGNPATARESFDAAARAAGTTAEQVRAESTGVKKVTRGIPGAIKTIGRTGASVLGNAELGVYNPPDYESVLQLNYLALSYLMNGDPAAFNVSRRSSDRQSDAFEDLNEKAARLQDEARVAFEAEKAEAERRLSEARSGDAASETDEVASQLQASYKQGDTCKPPNLPSAFVNPLGFYLNGLVYEISSVEFPEDLDPARISYEKALRLAPSSQALQAAVRDLNSTKPRKGRVVHVLIAEGLAPVRQALRMQLSVAGNLVPITLPRLACRESAVTKLQVRDQRGRVLANLDPLANIEGMMLQRQQDREAATTFGVMINATRGAGENRIAAQNTYAALAVGFKQENFDRPDMRSWSTLPARWHAARIYVPESVESLELVSLGAGGRVLASHLATLDRSSKQNVVYGRAMQQHLAILPTPALWIQGR